MDNLLSGFIGAILGVIGSVYIYRHSEKTKYRLAIVETLNLMEYTIRYEHEAYESTFKLFKAHLLSLQTSTVSLMAYSFYPQCIDKAWHDFKGMDYHHKKQGAEYMSLPENADSALKRIENFRNAIKNT